MAVARADTAAVPVAAEAQGSSSLDLAAFRMLLVYVVVLFVQPQNRFTFLWPLHIADLSFMGAVGLHVLACVQERRPIIRLGPATIVSLLLLMFAFLSQYTGIYQTSSAWNPYIDIITKNAVLAILLEAMMTSVQRVMAVQMVVLVATFWWIKAGVRLSAAGATYADDRLMGAAVGMIDNPNGFAYMMCLFLPMYLYMFQQSRRAWERWAFLGLSLTGVYIVFQTGSRTGLVTLMFMAIFILRRYGRHHLKGLFLIVLTVAVIFPLSGARNIERFKTIPQSVKGFLGMEDGKEHEGPMSQDEQSADERARKNEHTWGLIKEHLIFGVGVCPDESRFPSRWGMARGQVHCEILMAGRQMGLIGMGLYVAYWSIFLVGGGLVRKRARDRNAIADLGWTFQLQGLCIIVGGSFCPGAWHPPLMILAASVSALLANLANPDDPWVRLLPETEPRPGEPPFRSAPPGRPERFFSRQESDSSPESSAAGGAISPGRLASK